MNGVPAANVLRPTARATAKHSQRVVSPEIEDRPGVEIVPHRSQRALSPEIVPHRSQREIVPHHSQRALSPEIVPHRSQREIVPHHSQRALSPEIVPHRSQRALSPEIDCHLNREVELDMSNGKKEQHYRGKWSLQ
jgi:hypothetical protein